MYFDNKAEDWDSDPQKIERARVFAQEILNFITPDSKLTGFEFGCGTGLLSFQMKDDFKSIILADNSAGMIAVLKEKIQKAGINNFIPEKMDLFHADLNMIKSDVVYTLMTLHHMPDLVKTLEAFHSIVNNDGFLCIADLVKEDGSFHAHHPNFHGHNGFDREGLSKTMKENGFVEVFYKECFQLKKKVGDETKLFPLFLMICKKD